jgi:hypothetical protein
MADGRYGEEEREMRQEETINIAIHLFVCLIGFFLNLFAPIITLAFRSQTAIDIYGCIVCPLLWIASLMRLNLGGSAYFYTLFGLWGVIFFLGVILLRKGKKPYYALGLFPAIVLLAFIISAFYDAPFGRPR